MPAEENKQSVILIDVALLPTLSGELRLNVTKENA